MYQEISDKVKECCEKASFYYGRDFRIPSITFFTKGTSAGFASPAKWLVMFNQVLYLENKEQFLNKTVPHEVAHLIDYVINPENFVRKHGKRRSLHGPTFKFIMSEVLGAEDNSTTHTYNTKSVRRRNIKRRYVWACSRCDRQIELTPHKNKLQLQEIRFRNSVRYIHKDCNCKPFSYVYRQPKLYV